jgi:hypothetical protein
MTGFGETPATTSATDTPGAPFILAGEPTVTTGVLISTSVDSGNTSQTNIHRAGLCVAKITASSKFTEYLTAGAGGIGVFVGILMDTVNVKGPDGVARDTAVRIAVGGQPLINEAAVFGLDATAKTDQPEKFLWSSDYGAA